MIDYGTKKCPYCHLEGSVTMPLRVLILLADPNGPFIQDAWPESTAEQREQVISGTHPECWNEMFGEEDDENYE